jgi:hypothetical protein
MVYNAPPTSRLMSRGRRLTISGSLMIEFRMMRSLNAAGHWTCKSPLVQMLEIIALFASTVPVHVSSNKFALKPGFITVS